MTRSMDISFIVTAHAEGWLAHRTMRSVAAAVDCATNEGIRCEVIVALDAANDATREYFGRNWADSCRLLEVDHRDLGESRNAAVRGAEGKYIAFLDADDLVCPDWLVRSFAESEKHSPSPTVMVAATTIVFEGCMLRHDHVSSLGPEFRLEDFVASNYWNSIVFAPRELFQRVPFCPTTRIGGFGYEDWHWFSRVIDQGISIRPVPQTSVYVRRKREGSLLARHANTYSLLRPSPLFHPAAFTHEPGQESRRPAQGDSILHRRPRLFTLFPGADQRVGLFDRAIGLAPIRAARGVLRRIRRAIPAIGEAVSALRGARLPTLEPWLREQWQQMHQIEPQLFPDGGSLRDLQQYRVPRSPLGQAYGRLCQSVATEITHLFLVPWLKTGGADLEALNYIRCVAESAGTRALVIATERSVSSWAAKLPGSARFLEFWRFTRSLDEDQVRELLATFIVQLQPQVVHNLNSPLAFDVFARYGKALRQVSRLYVSLFCEEVTPEGKMAGYAFSHLPFCVDYLSGIFGDNNRFLRKIQDVYGIDGTLLHVHYQPIVLQSRQRPRNRVNGRMNVMWAGRLDRQKRPDLLLAIASQSKHLPVAFHMYGTSVLPDQRVRMNRPSTDNVVCHGAFDTLSSIEAAHDVFLNTSQWDGLPNILLEAIAAGLPVVTSDVGGIPELIINDQTGILVSPFDNVNGYLEGLERALAEPEKLNTMADQARALVRERHSWSRFAQTVEAVPGYCS
ncbi:MAG: glycosyltransferase [Planctomycetota bacterium]